MKRIVSLKKTTLDAIRDSINDGEIGLSFRKEDLPKVKKIISESPYEEVTEINGPNTYGICIAWFDYTGFGSTEEKELNEFEKGLAKEIQKWEASRNAKKDSISGETWIDTPELLEEDDFKDGDLKEYWVINLNDIKDEDIKLEVRIQTAEMMLDYLDDFKNRNVREEVEGDLRDFIKKNKTQKVHPKGSFKKIGEGKYTRRETEEPFTDSNGGIEDLFKKAIVKKGNWYGFDEKNLPKYQPRKFEWLAKSDNSCIVKYNGTEYYIYLNPTTGKLEVELN